MAFLTYRGRHSRGVTVLDVFFPQGESVDVSDEIAAVLADDKDFRAPAPKSRKKADADAPVAEPEEG